MAPDLKAMAAEGGDMTVFAAMTAAAMREDVVFDYYAVEPGAPEETGPEIVVALDELGDALVLEESELAWDFEGDGDGGDDGVWSSDDSNAEGNPDFDYPDEDTSEMDTSDGGAFNEDYGYASGGYFR